MAVGVNSMSEIYVGFADVWKVSHLLAKGEWLGAWRTDGPMDDLAVGADGAVYTVMDKSNRVYRFLADGTPDGQWQAGSHVITIAAGPLDGTETEHSVYVLWRPQRIGEPPSGPPRVTRYTPRGENLAEWEVDDRAYDVTVFAGSAETPDGVLMVADAGGKISRFAPDGSPLGGWSARTAEGARIAAGVDGPLYLVLQSTPADPSEIWRYSYSGEASLACGSLPAKAPRDIAVGPRDGDIHVLYPDELIQLDAGCGVVGRLNLEDLNGAPADSPGTPSTPAMPGTPTAPSTATRPPTETPHPTATFPALPPSPPDPVLPPEPPPTFFHIDGVAHEAAIGTYCWSGCVDTVGPITPSEPVVISDRTPLRLEVSASVPIASVDLRANRVRMEDATEITEGRWKGELVWRNVRGPSVMLPVSPIRDQTVVLELVPGLHVLEFTVYWAGWGDASFGLLVDVEGDQPLLLPWVGSGRPGVAVEGVLARRGPEIVLEARRTDPSTP